MRPAESALYGVLVALWLEARNQGYEPQYQYPGDHLNLLLRYRDRTISGDSSIDSIIGVVAKALTNQQREGRLRRFWETVLFGRAPH